MRAYHTIMEGYFWEGFEEEIYQHLRRCMDHVEMEEIHNSWEELAQPPLFPLRIRGDSSMSHSICMDKTYGKGIICLHNDLYNVYVQPLTIYVQDISQGRGILPSRLHCLPEAIRSIGDGHSLGGLGEIVSFAEHAHFAPYPIHFLQSCEEATHYFIFCCS